MTSKRIMSGMRPTGRLHIGHYFWGAPQLGTFSNRGGFDPYFSIVDWHALTTKYQDTSQVKTNIFEIALDWLCKNRHRSRARHHIRAIGRARDCRAASFAFYDHSP